MKSLERKLIYSITPFTLLDYPDKTAIIIWFAGCNMRCSYCYNPEIVMGKGKLSFADVRPFLASRSQFIDAVVLSGGECLLYDGIQHIIRAIKSMGFLVKIDTNGSKPHLLNNLLQGGLIDYVALDFKATKAKMVSITAVDFYKEFMTSLDILQHSATPFEVRTTIHSALLDADDIKLMIQTLADVGYTGKYFLQHFRDNTPTLGDLGISDYRIDLGALSQGAISVIQR